MKWEIEKGACFSETVYLLPNIGITIGLKWGFFSIEVMWLTAYAYFCIWKLDKEVEE